MIQEQIMTLNDCAKQVGVNHMTLRRLISRGEGPVCTVIGGVIRIREKHWTAWLDRQAVEAPGPVRKGRGKRMEAPAP
jgi:hypothetical protein